MLLDNSFLERIINHIEADLRPCKIDWQHSVSLTLRAAASRQPDHEGPSLIIAQRYLTIIISIKQYVHLWKITRTS